MPQSLSPRPWAETALAVAAPALAALAVAFALDWLSALAAALLALLVLVLAAATALPLVRDMAALADKAEELAVDEGQPRPWTRRTPLAADVALALTRAQRRITQNQRALEARAAGAESVVDSVPEPLLVLDSARRVVHANLAAETLLGARLPGHDLAALLRNPDLLEGARKTIRDGRARAVDFQLTTPVERLLRARIAPLMKWSEADEAIILTLEDLTAIRRTEQMRVDFVANVSHELKTPLTTLLGFIETLRGPAHDDEAARDRFLSIMEAQARRMTRIVDDLLSLSRIELDEHNPPTGSVAIGDLVSTVADGLELVAAQRRMTISIDLPADLPAVSGQVDQLAQVFRNLLENALKYGRPGTPIEVAARLGVPELAAGRSIAWGRVEPARTGYLTVTVTDHGDGIPREHLPRLTERFYRVDTARSREQGGTGLGLAIVKHIVNRHRGQLAIESDTGKGCRFTVTLPTARVEQAAY